MYIRLTNCTNSQINDISLLEIFLHTGITEGDIVAVEKYCLCNNRTIVYFSVRGYKCAAEINETCLFFLAKQYCNIAYNIAIF